VVEAKGTAQTLGNTISGALVVGLAVIQRHIIYLPRLPLEQVQPKATV
jgi:hypothetical protein